MDAIGADRVKAEYGDDVIAYVTTSKPKFKWVGTCLFYFIVSISFC